MFVHLKLSILRFVILFLSEAIIFFLLSTVVVILGALLSVAFFTLFERKILGLTQSRMGPNKVLLGGVLQPLIDGVKLLTKEFLFPQNVSV